MVVVALPGMKKPWGLGWRGVRASPLVSCEGPLPGCWLRYVREIKILAGSRAQLQVLEP